MEWVSGATIASVAGESDLGRAHPTGQMAPSSEFKLLLTHVSQDAYWHWSLYALEAYVYYILAGDWKGSQGNLTSSAICSFGVWTSACKVRDEPGPGIRGGPLGRGAGGRGKGAGQSLTDR